MMKAFIESIRNEAYKWKKEFYWYLIQT
jgi:hypothetical protein